MVGSQTASLIPDPSFAYNLGCRCPNDQCEAISDIYTSRPFQWHQKHPNARCFGPFCWALNIRESRRTPNPHLWECWASPPHLAKLGLRQNFIHIVSLWWQPLDFTKYFLTLRHVWFPWSMFLISASSLCSMACTSSHTFYLWYGLCSSSRNNISFEVWKVRCATKLMDNFRCSTTHVAQFQTPHPFMLARFSYPFWTCSKNFLIHVYNFSFFHHLHNLLGVIPLSHGNG